MERSGRPAPARVRCRPSDDGPRGDPADAAAGRAEGVGALRRAAPSRPWCGRALTGSGLLPRCPRKKIPGVRSATAPQRGNGVLRPGTAARPGPVWRQLCRPISRFRDSGGPPRRSRMGVASGCRVRGKPRKCLILWGVPSGLKSRLRDCRDLLARVPRFLEPMRSRDRASVARGRAPPGTRRPGAGRLMRSAPPGILSRPGPRQGRRVGYPGGVRLSRGGMP